MKNKKNQFGRTITSLMVARYIPIISALTVSVLLTRILSQEMYGEYRSVWLVFGLLMPLLTGMLNGTLYYRGNKSGSISLAISSAVVQAGLSGFLSGTILWLSASLISTWLNIPHLLLALQFFSLYIGLGVVVSVAEPVFVLLHRKKWLLWYNLVVHVFEVTLVVSLFYLRFSITEVFQFLIISPILRGLLLSFMISAHVRINLNVIGEVKTALPYAFGLFIAVLAGVVTLQIDTWVVRTLISDHQQFALFEIGARKIPFMAAMISAIASVLIVNFRGKESGNDIRQLFFRMRQASGYLFRFILPMLVVVGIFADDLLVILYEKYADSAPIFRVYLGIVTLQFFFADTYLLASGRSLLVAKIGLIEMVLNLILSILFLNVFGLIGPAWATLFVFIFYQLAAMVASVRLGDAHLSDFVPQRVGNVFIYVLSALFISLFIDFVISNGKMAFLISLILTGSMITISGKDDLADFWHLMHHPDKNNEIERN